MLFISNVQGKYIQTTTECIILNIPALSAVYLHQSVPIPPSRQRRILETVFLPLCRCGSLAKSTILGNFPSALEMVLLYPRRPDDQMLVASNHLG